MIGDIALGAAAGRMFCPAGAPTTVRLQVADDGSGIPGDQLEAIFERFHRADTGWLGAASAGSGLGLTIARAIVHAHGGTLTATGTGRGAVFTITLPRPADQNASRNWPGPDPRDVPHSRQWFPPLVGKGIPWQGPVPVEAGPVKGVRARGLKPSSR